MMDDKQDSDKDKDEDINQDFRPDDSSSSQTNVGEVQPNDNTVKLDGRVLAALRDLEIERAKHAKKKPHIYAKYRAHKNHPPQFFTLSKEEQCKMDSRLYERKHTEIYWKTLVGKESLRPPKHPNPPLPLFRQLKKPSSRKKKFTAPPEQSTPPPKKRKVSDPSSSKIVIATEVTGEEEEELEEEEEEAEEEGGNLDPFKSVIGKTKNANMKELNDLKNKFIKDNKILNLEGKMYYMLHKGREKIFKNYHERAREPKRNFYEWTKDCDGLPRINDLKSQAVEQGLTISRVIVDIMYLMSQNKPKEMEAKFQALEDSLRCVNKDENTLVIWRIVDFLRFADRQLKMFRDSDLVAIRGKEVMIETEGGGDDDDDYLQESILDPILFMLLKEILRMEIFWGYRRFSCSRMEIIDAIPSLEEEVASFDLSSMELRVEMNNAVEEHLFGDVLLAWENNNDYLGVEWKLNELWHELRE